MNSQIKLLIKRAKTLLHLHACEQEGFEDGKPSEEEWAEAISELEEVVFKLDQEC